MAVLVVFSMTQIVFVTASGSDISLSTVVTPSMATTGTVVMVTTTLVNTASVIRTVTLTGFMSFRSFGGSEFTLPLPKVKLELAPKQTIQHTFQFTVSKLFPMGTYDVTLTASDTVGSTSATATLIVAALTSNCPNSTLVYEGNGLATPGGTTALFQCSGGQATFSSSGGKAMPTITGNTGALTYASMTIVPHVTGAKTCTAGTVLVSGVALKIAAGSYDYCFTLPPGESGALPSVTITWSQ